MRKQRKGKKKKEKQSQKKKEEKPTLVCHSEKWPGGSLTGFSCWKWFPATMATAISLFN